MTDLEQLRRHAIFHSLFPATSLREAIDRMGFVQADPIRSPARAQDLILRHRAQGYRAGDLEKHYPGLGLEEDYFYAYGFLPRRVWQLLHPREGRRLSQLEQGVLEAVRQRGTTHPQSLAEEFGRRRVRNAWGGYSKATRSALERLHHLGHVRVVRRDQGIRVYAPVEPWEATLAPEERLREIIRLLAGIFAPISAALLQRYETGFRRGLPGLSRRGSTIRELLDRGELEQGTVDGIRYFWPVEGAPASESPRQVRFLAPFDPVVWHRERFEHFWGWPYRFEAYVPPAKRIRGYYAMPLLWHEGVIGWVNAGMIKGRLEVDFGYINSAPKDRAFIRELEAETARLKEFLRADPEGETPLDRSGLIARRR